MIALGKLGARHVEYGVLPAHYGIVGEALLYTLETALGDKWIPRVKNGWTLIYGLVSTAMMTGAQRRLDQKELRLGRRRQAIAESTEKKESPEDHSQQSMAERRRKGHGSRIPISAALAKITGIKGLAKDCPDTSRQEQVSKLLEDALSEASSIASTVSSCDPADLALDGLSYCETINNVYNSWDKIRAIPNYQEVAGVLLFRK